MGGKEVGWRKGECVGVGRAGVEGEVWMTWRGRERGEGMVEKGGERR